MFAIGLGSGNDAGSKAYDGDRITWMNNIAAGQDEKDFKYNKKDIIL